MVGTTRGANRVIDIWALMPWLPDERIVEAGTRCNVLNSDVDHGGDDTRGLGPRPQGPTTSKQRLTLSHLTLGRGFKP